MTVLLVLLVTLRFDPLTVLFPYNVHFTGLCNRGDSICDLTPLFVFVYKVQGETNVCDKPFILLLCNDYKSRLAFYMKKNIRLYACKKLLLQKGLTR